MKITAIVGSSRPPASQQPSAAIAQSASVDEGETTPWDLGSGQPLAADVQP